MDRSLRIRLMSSLFVQMLRAVSIIGVVFLTGCGWILGYHNYTKVRPTRLDIVGSWIPNKSTLEDMVERGHYDISVLPKITLKDDGAFVIENMPDWCKNRNGESHGGRYSYSGVWRIENEQDSGRYILHLEFSNTLTTMSLVGQKPPYEIFVFVGDADAARGMTFLKQ